MEMLFKSVDGQPAPVVADDLPDGVHLFTLDQAAAHFSMPVDALQRLHNAIWGNVLGAKSLITDDEDAAPAATTDATRAVMRDVRLQVLKAVRYPKLSAEQFEYFVRVCRERHLSPWADQIFCDVQHDERSGLPVPKIIVGIAGLRLVAQRTGEHAGIDAATFDYGDEGINPRSCTITVYRLVGGQRQPFSATVHWAERYPGNGNDALWDKMPHTCIERCAEAAALRKGFSEELSGLYTPEEMAQGRRRERIGAAAGGRSGKWLGPDDGMPSTKGTLEMRLIELGLTDKARRAAVLEQLRADFALGDDPRGYAMAYQAVRDNPDAYALCA